MELLAWEDLTQKLLKWRRLLQKIIRQLKPVEKGVEVNDCSGRIILPATTDDLGHLDLEI